MRRTAPVIIVAVGLLTLLAAFIWYSQSVLGQLRSEAKQTATTYARVVGSLSDTSTDAAAVLAARADIVESLKELHVPVILTAPAGDVSATANLPFDDDMHSAHTRAYADTLDMQNAPIVGAVSMDMLVADVTGLDVSPGDEVVIIGSQGADRIDVREMAAQIGTIPYEILCRIGSRIQRVYDEVR